MTRSALNDRAADLFEKLGLHLDPRKRVGALTVAQQQMVEISKAFSYNASVLIMDEPTAALTDKEIDELFRITRDLRSKGVGIVHISHRLQELKQISDRITVMRDGHYINTIATADAQIDEIISMMVGRTIFEAAPEIPEVQNPEVVLEVRHLNRGRHIRDVSFSVHRGEIVGIAGLIGAGRTEVARAIFGADPIESGEILIHGRPVRIQAPSDAVRLGIGYLSEDRKRYGLALKLDVETNIVLASWRRFLNRIRRDPLGANAPGCRRRRSGISRSRRRSCRRRSRTSQEGHSRRSSSANGSRPIRRSCSSTSPLEASTSEPRARSITCSTSSLMKAKRS